MFDELIRHGEDIVRRLAAEQASSPADRAAYPDHERVPIDESETWRAEVERRIAEFADDYAMTRYEVTRRQLGLEIQDPDLERYARWHRRVLNLLADLQRGQPEMPARYDVALSFAGEDRPFAGRLAELLRARNVKVFYDEYEKAALWGRDLYQHLGSVYQQQARYCVIFLSAHYRDKLWTNHELKSAQARAFAESREYLLPVRLDDTEVPGVLPTAAYLDLRSTPIEEVADLLVAKIKAAPSRQ